MATLCEIIRGMQDGERQVEKIINALPAMPGMPKDQLHRQRIEALQLILDDMPTDMGERVIE